MTETISTDYLVTGMTCEHCVASITEEVGSIVGVSDVTVALVPGGASVISVTSAQSIDNNLVQAAVTEAGYTLVSA
ncbi:MAG: heavy-metal-associated domain-containing protein [Microbacteriaceae bacterium]